MRQQSPWARFGIGVGAVAVASILPAVSAGAGAAAEPLVTTADAPAWTAGHPALGAAPRGQRVDLDVVLRLHDAAGAEQLATAVSTPGSGAYRHYMTPQQFRERFSPSQSEVDAVARYLRSNGLHVDAVPANHLYLRASGTVAQAEAAFHTHLATFAVNGAQRRAPDRPVALPQSLAGLVDGVVGLSTGTDRRIPHHAADTAAAPRANPKEPPPPAFVNAPPCSTYWAEKIATTLPPAYGKPQPYAPCGYTPAQFRGAYDLANAVGSGIDGSGSTVAITDAYAAPTILADAQQYSANRGEPGFAPGQFSQVLPSSFTNQALCGPQGWYGEETLDVEAVHGVAPGAAVKYVASASCFDVDFIDALNKVIDNHLADNISNSWGGVGDINQLDAATAKAYTHTFLQAVIQGIGVFFSSGDSGDEIANAGFRTVDFPASDPWVTAVGGTSLAVGKANNYLFETGWGTSNSNLANGAWSPTPPGTYLYGAGGGTSQVFRQPAYQKGVVPDSISRYFGGSFKGRAVPDIAMDADPQTGMLIGETQTFPDGSVKYSEYRIGGTSLACPLMVGMEAIADQATGFNHGFANPAIYKLFGSSALRDVVAPSHPLAVVRNNFVNSVDASAGITTKLRSLNTTGTLRVIRGYDDVTGVGTPVGFEYISSLGF